MSIKKILVSSGWGAGWSTWNGGEVADYMLTYQPIIEFLESGGVFTEKDKPRYPEFEVKHPLLKQLVDECKERFGADYVCLLGVEDLVVEVVSGPFRVTEYDGYESVEFKDELDWKE